MPSGEIWDAEQVQLAETIEAEEVQEGFEQDIAEEIIQADKADNETADPVFSLPNEDNYRITEFQNILEKLIAQGMKEKNQEELRIRKLDEKIRFHQQGLRQVAAAQEMKQRRGRKGKRRKR